MNKFLKLASNKFFLLFLLGLAAVFLRFYKLGAWDLHTDVAKYGLGIDWPHSFVLPSLMVFSQKIFGMSEWAVRLPMVLFSLAGTWLYYLIGRDYFKEKKFGLWAFALAALMPYQIIIAREGFLDAALASGAVLTYYLWLKSENNASLVLKIALFLSILVLPWFKIQAIAVYFVLGAYLLVRQRGRIWRDERFFYLLFAGGFFLVYLLGQPEQLYAFIYAENGGMRLSGVGKFLSRSWESYGALLFFTLGGFYLRYQRKKTFGQGIFLLGFLHLAVVAFFLLFTMKQYYYYVLLDFAVITGTLYFLKAIPARRRILNYGLFALVLSFNFYFVYKSNSYLRLYPENASVFWLEQSGRLNRIILAAPEPRRLYLDEKIGFQGKWNLAERVSKLEHLKAFPNEPASRFLLLYAQNQDRFQNYFPSAREYDFGEMVLLEETK